MSPILLSSSDAPEPPAAPIWSAEKANAWYSRQPWMTGCNFIPSTAINQLEMWQAESFDPEINRHELGLAASLGFNTVRVYLHNLAWEIDAEGFKQRIDTFLSIAADLGIRPLLVLFDDCWNTDPAHGPQSGPMPGVHNSGWLQSPGGAILKDPSRWAPLEAYTKDILQHFATDERILMWDLYNEPGNSGYEEQSLPLLQAVFNWAWSVRPEQPLSSAIWRRDFIRLNEFQTGASDVLTFHNYEHEESMEESIAHLKAMGKPVICTEYMARTTNSRFESHLPILKKHGVGAINWGLVSGKTNTIFPWGSPEGTPEPEIWFHDIFRTDGSAYDDKEVELIRQMTKK